MSSSMETNLLLSDVEPGPKYWREVDMQKWEVKSEGCPARSTRFTEPFCKAAGTDCYYETCFGRYWGVM